MRIIVLSNNPLVKYEHSQLFQYYNSRIYGDTSKDTGSTIRASFKAMNKYGMCPENMWDYETT